MENEFMLWEEQLKSHYESMLQQLSPNQDVMEWIWISCLQEMRS